MPDPHSPDPDLVPFPTGRVLPDAHHGQPVRQVQLSVGVVLGLILVPNGKYFGQLLGDEYPDYSVEPLAPMGRTTFIDSEDSLVSAANFTRSPLPLLSLLPQLSFL